MRTVDDHMDLNYEVIVAEERDFDGTVYYVAFHEELYGIEGVGDTKEEAIQDLRQSKEIWFKNMIANDDYVPLPKNFER